MPYEKKTINKKAQYAGKRSAIEGCLPPPDETLVLRYGQEGMKIYKESYAQHCGTPEEQHIRKIQTASKICARKRSPLPLDTVLAQRYGAAYINIYKDTYLEYYFKYNKTAYVPAQNNTRDQNTNNLKAKNAGRTSANHGGSLPTDETLAFNYGPEGVDIYKESYALHCGTPQEQRIKRIKHAARQCIYKNRNLLPDEALAKKYTPKEIEIYKETFLEHLESKNLRSLNTALQTSVALNNQPHTIPLPPMMNLTENTSQKRSRNDRALPPNKKPALISDIDINHLFSSNMYHEEILPPQEVIDDSEYLNISDTNPLLLDETQFPFTDILACDSSTLFFSYNSSPTSTLNALSPKEGQTKNMEDVTAQSTQIDTQESIPLPFNHLNKM